MIYIDKNNYNKNIRAATIFRRKSCIYLLKQNIIYTVYSAEFTEIELILNLIKIENLIWLILVTDKLKNLVILINNQIIICICIKFWK